MKRHLAKLALFLLLGAIINVAVAWGCALWLDPTGAFANAARVGITAQYGPCWLYGEFIKPGAARLIAVEQTNYWNERMRTPPYVVAESDVFVPGWSKLGTTQAEEPFPSSSGRIMIEDARGWPMLALRSSCDPCTYFDSSFQVRGGIPLAPYSRSFSVDINAGMLEPQPAPHIKAAYGALFTQLKEPRSIPFVPLWPGFAINTIFYAAILSGGWLPFAALLGAFRRRRRIKRGLCPKCAYDLRGSQKDFCPECGAAITMPDSRKPTAESPQ